MLNSNLRPTDPTARLVVRNMNGTNEEWGFRLFWSYTDGTACEAFQPTQPFARQRDAKAYGLRRWGEQPQAVRW